MKEPIPEEAEIDKEDQKLVEELENLSKKEMEEYVDGFFENVLKKK